MPPPLPFTHSYSAFVVMKVWRDKISYDYINNDNQVVYSYTRTNAHTYPISQSTSSPSTAASVSPTAPESTPLQQLGNQGRTFVVASFISFFVLLALALYSRYGCSRSSSRSRRVGSPSKLSSKNNPPLLPFFFASGRLRVMQPQPPAHQQPQVFQDPGESLFLVVNREMRSQSETPLSKTQSQASSRSSSPVNRPSPETAGSMYTSILENAVFFPQKHTSHRVTKSMPF